MQATKNIKLKLIHNDEKAIAISFGQGEIFWSCARGADLDCFDDLLLTLIPEIDFEKFTPSIARSLERQLYFTLANCLDQKEALQEFNFFIEGMEYRFSKKNYSSSTKKLVDTMIQSTQKRMSVLSREIKNNKGLMYPKKAKVTV